MPDTLCPTCNQGVYLGWKKGCPDAFHSGDPSLLRAISAEARIEQLERALEMIDVELRLRPNVQIMREEIQAIIRRAATEQEDTPPPPCQCSTPCAAERAEPHGGACHRGYGHWPMSQRNAEQN